MSVLRLLLVSLHLYRFCVCDTDSVRRVTDLRLSIKLKYSELLKLEANGLFVLVHSQPFGFLAGNYLGNA